MKAIYETKDRHIFESVYEFTLEKNHNTYAIDASDVNNITVHPLSELTTLAESRFDFICQFHPDYSQSADVASLDDLDCLIDGECNQEKKIRLTDEWGSDPFHWEYHRERIMDHLFKESIKSYKDE